MRRLDRRRFLAASGVLALAPRLRFQDDVTLPGGTLIRPRSAWAGERRPAGPTEVEAPGDVRFLLVHHTVSSNSYAADAVPGMIRGFYDFHTGADKGWPDVAYNFLIDRFGTVWEARQGSIDGPVKGSATGGSQGFAMLASFIGDHSLAPPSPEAQAAMVDLLAWLADTYGIDTSPGATTSFVSRGSNLHPAGKTVLTSTISGHRQMSTTGCPGDFAMSLVQNEFPALVSATRTGVVSAPAARRRSEADLGSVLRRIAERFWDNVTGRQ